MSRKSFSIHSDYYNELCGLTKEQRGDVLLALIEWARDGEPPNLDPICAMLCRLMKAQTERISSANSVNGARGGRGNKSQKSEESDKNEEKKKSGKSGRKQKKPTVTNTDTDTSTDTKSSDTPPTPQGGEGEKDRATEIKEIWASYTFSHELKKAVLDWGKYKKEKREDYKPEGLRNLLSEIRNRATEYGDDAVIAVIRESMASNYKGIAWGHLRDRGGIGNGATNRGGNHTPGVPTSSTSGDRPVLGTVLE